MVEANPTKLPTSQIALSLLFGFTFMLIIEQLVSPHAHSHSHTDALALHTVKADLQHTSSDLEFDAELGDLEHDEGMDRAGYNSPKPAPAAESVGASTGRAFPLTFGLVIHGLADGLALGVSFLARDTSGSSSTLSLVVFLALIIHKGHIRTYTPNGRAHPDAACSFQLLHRWR